MSPRYGKIDISLDTKEKRLSAVLRGSNRRDIYVRFLDGPLTPSQISSYSKIPLTNVSRVLKFFLKHKLIENLTRNWENCCRYQLTQIALEFKDEVLEYEKLRIEKHNNT